MPFDNEIWNKPAIQGDMAGIAINLVVAIEAIHSALSKLSASTEIDVNDDLVEIQTIARDVNKIFVELTGYKAASDAD